MIRQTKAFNTAFKGIGQNKNLKNFLLTWFNIGAFVGTLSMFFSVGILVYNIVHMILKPKESQILTPMIPGINIPSHHIPYFFITLILSGIFHEFGHAVAAIRDNQKVSSSGLFVFFIYPGAFVNMKIPDFQYISVPSGLRIICAGVWHNFVLSVIAYLLVQTFIGSILVFPLYTKVDGVIITNTYGLLLTIKDVFNNLPPGSIITKINDKEIHNYNDWENYFNDVQINNFTSLSYCYQKLEEKDMVDDCITNQSYVGSLLGWEYENNIGEQKKTCLLPSQVVNELYCEPNKLKGKSGVGIEGKCNSDQFCYTPIVKYPEIIIKAYTSDGSVSLSLGHPFVFYYSIQVANYQLRFDFLTSLLPLSLPNIIHDLLWYLFSLSGGLTIMNAAPMFKLDGQYICYLVLKYVLTAYDQRFSNPMQNFDSLELRIHRWERIIYFSTFLIIITNILLSLSIL